MTSTLALSDLTRVNQNTGAPYEHEFADVQTNHQLHRNHLHFMDRLKNARNNNEGDPELAYLNSQLEEEIRKTKASNAAIDEELDRLRQMLERFRKQRAERIADLAADCEQRIRMFKAETQKLKDLCTSKEHDIRVRVVNE